MSKKILFLVGSPRSNGNTATLVKFAAEGAQASGAVTEIVDVTCLSNLPGGCAGCMQCQPGKFRCALQDETADLINRLSEYDAIVLATPIYFFNFSAQLKRFTDRFLALCSFNDDGSVSSTLSKTQLAVLATSGSDAALSGLEVLRCNMRYLSNFCNMPEVKFFHHGCCGSDPSVLADDPVLVTQARDFGRELAR